MEAERLRESALDLLKEGEQYNYLTDWKGMKCARQLVYNRQLRYPGCRIDTHKALKLSNLEGMYVLLIRRVSFGKEETERINAGESGRP